ncbi:MAG: hypothetical protein GY847_39875 [Proteobacteria bacterium]|nr:hypothetical protein [Pseudomonadota bacterium]
MEKRAVKNTDPLMDNPAVALTGKYVTIESGQPITVIPYFGSLYILDLLRRNKNTDLILPFLRWHIDHLNYPDKHGLTGSIYDYEVDPDGRERSLEDYDSVDSYSALFLIVVYDYFRASGDVQFVKRHKKKLLDIAYTIVHLQGEDGLTVAKPDYPVKYLMDNCEVYGGLKAFEMLARELNWKEASYYETRRRAVADAIAWLYDKEVEIFSWALEDDKKVKSDWNKLYPDAYAQLFPVYYDIPTVTAKTKKMLWKEFNRRYKSRALSLPVEQRVMYELTKARVKKGFK